jgi:hypothetical protein
MERNTALFEKIAAAIEEQPALYAQRTWAKKITNSEGETCGTAHCIAGWAVFIADGQHCSPEGSVIAPDGLRVHAQERAAELLGLYPSEADRLFDAMWRDGEAVEDVADELREIGRGERITD